MRKNIIYSVVVFFLVFVFVCSMFVTSLVMGDSNWGDLKFVLGIATAVSTVVAFPFFFAITFLRNRFFPAADSLHYRPGIRFFAIVSILLAISVYGGADRMQAAVTHKRETAMATEQQIAEMKLREVQARAAAEAAARKTFAPRAAAK